jgi:uncharacterized protein
VPRGSFFLLGPRGTGKSTWAREHLDAASCLDLLDEALLHDLMIDPALFAAKLRPLPAGSTVIVDEVQRHPPLLNEVHRCIEQQRLRFCLLGSSARKLKTAGTNLLAGRALRCMMYPFVPLELAPDFALDRALQLGTLPIVWSSPEPEATLRAYVDLYLREEIRAEAAVRNLPGFVRFLPAAAILHGQLVNVSSLARDVGIARTTVATYLDILEDTLLVTRLSGYEARLRVRERKHPKLFWIDPGIVRAIKRQLGPLAIEERGSLLEGFVLMVLRVHQQQGGLFDEIHYWAPSERTETEVDFVLRRDRELLAIEVKTAARLAGRHFSGLRAIAGLDRLVRRVLVYGGRHPQRTADGIEVWPIGTFFETLGAGTLWP